MATNQAHIGNLLRDAADQHDELERRMHGMSTRVEREMEALRSEIQSLTESLRGQRHSVESDAANRRLVAAVAAVEEATRTPWWAFWRRPRVRVERNHNELRADRTRRLLRGLATSENEQFVANDVLALALALKADALDAEDPIHDANVALDLAFVWAGINHDDRTLHDAVCAAMAAAYEVLNEEEDDRVRVVAGEPASMPLLFHACNKLCEAVLEHRERMALRQEA